MSTGLTATYSLPYSLQTDPPDVAADSQAHAVAVESVLLIKAPNASPTFTGVPIAPTAAVDTNTTQLATTAYVVGQGYLKSAIASSTYAPLASPTFTGVPAAPTATLGTNTTQVATTAFVAAGLAALVTLPTQTGNSGKFLGTNGSAASWNNIAQSDVTGLSTILSGLSTTYAPVLLTTTTASVSYTLTLTDNYKVVEISNASANTLTVPLNSSVAFPVGTQITIIQTGAGQTTITPAGGVTINSISSALKIMGQWGSATLIKRATDTWVAVGALTT
jgi:hypothetical protein